MSLFIVSCLIAVFISFLCSLAEAVLLTLNPVKLKTLSDSGASFATSWLDLKKHLPRTISAILVLNTIAHTGGATIAGSAFDELYGDEWIWLFSILFTIVILFGTEILPKIIGVNYSYELAPYISGTLKVLTRILKPILWVSDLLGKALSNSKEHSQINRQDFNSLIQMASSQKLIGTLQGDIMLRSSEMNVRTIQEIMLPLNKVDVFSDDLNVDQMIDLARKSLHTRYPVHAVDNPNNLVGYVNIKELALMAPKINRNSIADYLRPLLFISSTAPLDKIIKEMILKKRHLAIIENEQNKPIGMVTLEDILEELVGEIDDEFDF